MRTPRRQYSLAMVAAVLCTLAHPAATEAQLRRQRRPELQGVSVRNRLGKQLQTNIPFVDHAGKRVLLSRYFGDKPVILTMNYYRCETLCSVMLNGFTQSLRKVKWKPGKQFRIVTISIAPDETHDLARKKREAYRKFYGASEGEFDWTFLVGTRRDIDRVATQIGFTYRYVAAQKIYSHVPVVFFFSPGGKLTRYLQGIAFEPRDIKFSLMDASNGKLGTVVDKFIHYCYSFDPNAGRYGPLAFNIMKIGGAITVLVLGTFLGIMWRREHQNRLVESGS